MTDERYKASLVGAQNRTAGLYFEQLITRSCESYKRKCTAYIDKTPEPMKPLSKPDNKGIFKACYTSTAQPDYKGVLNGGRSICFEAKHTDTEKMLASRVTDAQAEVLRQCDLFGAVAGVLCSFSLQDFYFVPWEIWDHMKEEYGRKYITKEDVERYRCEVRNGVIEFLTFVTEGECDV